MSYVFFFFFSSRRRHTRLVSDWSSDVCSSDLKRDYDVGLPEFRGDPEQLIQAVLNIARNAAQAILGAHADLATGHQGGGEITLRTRVARQVTLARRFHRLALELQVVDNGPGVPAEIREQIFHPLVSGREGGRSEEHTSELQSLTNIVCRLLLEKKKNITV